MFLPINQKFATPQRKTEFAWQAGRLARVPISYGFMDLVIVFIASGYRKKASIAETVT